MLLIVGTVRVPADDLERALPAMERMVRASRAEDGCFGYAYAADLVDPGVVHVKELWRDRAALDAHFAAPHLQEWRDTWLSLGISDRQLRLYEVDDGQQL